MWISLGQNAWQIILCNIYPVPGYKHAKLSVIIKYQIWHIGMFLEFEIHHINKKNIYIFIFYTVFILKKIFCADVNTVYFNWYRISLLVVNDYHNFLSKRLVLRDKTSCYFRKAYVMNWKKKKLWKLTTFD